MSERQEEKSAELRGRIAEAKAELEGQMSQTPWGKRVALVFSAAAMYFFWKDFNIWWIGSACLLTLFVIFWLIGHTEGVAKMKGKIERLQEELDISRDLPLVDKNDSSSYFQNLVTINVTNLREYYFLVKQHTNGSFRAAIGAGIAGFAFIIIGLIVAYFRSAADPAAVIAASAGIITEFISGVFFFLYNKTVRQLKDYHDSLLDVQNVLLSLKLLESVEDPALRAPMITVMLEFLMQGKSMLKMLPENNSREN